MENELTLVRLYQYRVFLTSDAYVDVHAEDIHDAWKLGRAMLYQQRGIPENKQYEVYIPLSEGIDYCGIWGKL